MIENEFGRRAFMKGLLVVAGSSMLVTVEGLIDQVRSFGDTAPTLASCEIYKNAQTSSYGSAYANGAGRWWAVCNPFANDVGGGDIGFGQIKNEYCNDDGYHRQDNQAGPYAVVYDYSRRATTCAGVNAWSWKVSIAPTWQNKRSRRCSDGQRVTRYDGDVLPNTRINTVCKQMLPGFDPAVGTLPFDQWTPDGCDPDAVNPAGC